MEDTSIGSVLKLEFELKLDSCACIIISACSELDHLTSTAQKQLSEKNSETFRSLSECVKVVDGAEV